MTAPARSVDSRWVALTALTVLFGLQCLRALLPLAVFMLRDRFGWHAGLVGLAMMTVLAAGFLAAPARRAIGPRRFLWITAGGLALARLALQAWTGDPLVDLGLAIAAAILFFSALPALAGGGTGSLILGWLMGLATDTALHGAYGTWDLIWRSGPASLIGVGVLVTAHGRLRLGLGQQAGEGAGSGQPAVAWSWVAFGPLMFLELLVLGNVARLAALTGWELESAALWTLAGRVLALAAVALVVARGRLAWPVAALLALALAGSFVVAWPRGAAAALLLTAAQVLAAALWSMVILAAGEGRSSGQRLAAGYGFGLLAFGAFLFLYYGGFDVRMPFSRHLVPPVAALGLGAVAIAVSRPAPGAGARFGRGWLLAAPMLFILPLIRLAAAPPDAGAATGWPLTVRTYNLHLGIDPRGHLGLERIAATIEAENPDVVALQEVPRGWLITGSADVLSWLSRRLGMYSVFGATTDPLWGNAVLSRQPILDHQTLDLPTKDLLIRRGLLSARIDPGDGVLLRGDGADVPFEIIVTHHHHLRDGGAIRELQSRAILDFWQGRGRTAVAGDFNGRPGEPEIEMLREAGLGDVLDLAGVEPGYTHPSGKPVKRIDYIWITPDLAASEAAVPHSPASDHLPVVATLDPK